MNPDEFEALMRAGEAYHGLKVEPDKWIVLRVDGRGFSKFTLDQEFDKPFDPRFRDLMLATTAQLLEDVGGVYAFVESDEISVLLPKDTDFFKRSIEKLVSISAASATATFSIAAGTPVHFDSRIWVGDTLDDVVAYFSWRQADARRCCLNGWIYWTLRKQGLSKRTATSLLRQVKPQDRVKMLERRGIRWDSLPDWQKNGLAFSYRDVARNAVNPMTGAKVVAHRRELILHDELDDGDDYRAMVSEIAWRSTWGAREKKRQRKKALT